MKSIYGHSPWEVHAHPMSSGTWKHIVSSKSLALLHTTANSTFTLLWTPSSSGIFTFSSAWNISRTPSPTFDLVEVVWNQATCPKMSCCLLRALTSRLLTRTRLHSLE